MNQFFRALLLSLICCGFYFNANAQVPSVQAYNVAITNRTNNSLTASWTRGNGQYCLVVVKPFSNSTSYPVSGSTSAYSSSSVYGSGANLGNSNYVVYKGTGTSLTITGLSASTQYMVIVYEYNIQTIITSFFYYNTSYGAANIEGAYTLCTEPATNASLNAYTNINYTSATINYAPGSGSYTLVCVDNLTNGSNYYAPIDGTGYSMSTSYGNGSLLSGDNYVVYNGTASSVNVSNLTSATTYRVRVFSFCGSLTGATYNYRLTGYSYSDFSTLNYQPTMNTISNQTVCMNSGTSYAYISGIGDGSTLESQTVSVTATSSNQTLIPNSNITVSYSGLSSTGYIYFYPASNQYGTTTITVTANDGGPNNNTIVRTFTVTVNPYPSAAGSISGNTTVCKNGSNYTYTIPAIANATGYNWSFPSGTVIVSGSNTNSVTVNFPATMGITSGTVSVYGTNSYGCGSGTSSSKTIYFDAAPTIADAGADQIICNGTTQLQGNPASVGSGLWTLGSGSAIFNNSAQYNTNVTGISSGQTVALNWTITNGVCPASTDQVLVTYNPAAPQCQIFADFFASTTTPCVGNTVTFTDNSVGATGWSWNFGANASPSTSGLQNPTVTFTGTGLQTITLTITGPNGTDSETKTNYINVNSVPGSASAISGLTTVCAGDNQISYSINPIAGATNYVWVLPSGATINSGANTEAVTVNYDPAAQSGTISVSGQNTCGTGTGSSLSITVNPLPDDAFAITGSIEVCQGETGVAYAIPTLNNTTTYNWTLPSGATIATGNNSESVTLDYSNLATSGVLSVYGSNSCGDGATATLNITVDPLPSDAGLITGQSWITNCPVSDSVAYYIPAIANATNYNWYLPTGASVIYGSGTDSVLVSFAYGANSGNVVVEGENACGVGQSSTFSVSVDGVLTQDICLVTVNDSSNRNIVVWEKDLNPAIESYNVYRDVAGLGYTLVGNVNVDSLSQFTDYDPGVDPNITQYRYEVSVVDTCGNEGPLSAFNQTIYVFPPVVSGNDIILNWDPYVGTVTGFYYRILRDTASTGNWNAIDSVPDPTTVYTDLNAINEGSSISYRIEIVMPGICVATRAQNHNTTRSNRTAAVMGASNVEDILLSTDVQVFPNPANDHVSVQLNQAMNNKYVLLEIFDLNGRVILTENMNSNRKDLDVSELSKGLYQVKITMNGASVVKKLVIN